MMRYLLLAALAVGSVGGAYGQDTQNGAGQATLNTFSMGEITPTPEMWFYEQARRDYMDPQMMLRRKAESQARLRRDRIAARKWYGYSAARPNLAGSPMMGYYGPNWTRDWNHAGRRAFYASTPDAAIGRPRAFVSPMGL